MGRDRPKPRVGISSCLMGERTRYDGDHRLAQHVLDSLGPHVEWIPICPEVEAGFGLPRETLRLEGTPEAPRMITTETRRDRTEEMNTWTRRRLGELADSGIAGLVLKKNSPSCGPAGVTLFPAGTPPAEPNAGVAPFPVASGLFALAARNHWPGLPVADEVMLLDPDVAAEFLVRVRARAAKTGGGAWPER